MHADGQVLGHVALLHRANHRSLHVSAELEQVWKGGVAKGRAGWRQNGARPGGSGRRPASAELEHNRNGTDLPHAERAAEGWPCWLCCTACAVHAAATLGGLMLRSTHTAVPAAAHHRCRPAWRGGRGRGSKQRWRQWGWWRWGCPSGTRASAASRCLHGWGKGQQHGGRSRQNSQGRATIVHIVQLLLCRARAFTRQAERLSTLPLLP